MTFTSSYIILTSLTVLGILNSPAAYEMCIRSMFGEPCKEDTDCVHHHEVHLRCNKTNNVNICSFNEKALIGHVFENWDCPGNEFSAVEWANPVSLELSTSGLDCMRLCLYTETCFGIVIKNLSCYLKNDICFLPQNLIATPNTMIGVIKVVREDMHCGNHYPFIRKRANETLTEWQPHCPASHMKLNPYRCCTFNGLCASC